MPIHDGGDSSSNNITPPISVRMHAMFHYDRWKVLRQRGDYLAFLMLLGQTSQSAIFRIQISAKEHSARMKGRRLSESHRMKISKALSGKSQPNMVGRKPWNKGLKGVVTVSAETRAKISAASRLVKERQRLDGTLPDICKPGKKAWNKGLKNWRVWTPHLRAKMAVASRNNWALRKSEAVKPWQSSS